MNAEQPVTALLAQWRDGDARALDALTPLVYDELHQLAVSLFRGERQNHTLQPTAIVNEAYVRLTDARIAWQDRSHFFALAAQWFLLFVYAVTTVGFFMTLKLFFCSQCMNFACPLNGVDEAARQAFFERNPEVAEAWKNV